MSSKRARSAVLAALLVGWSSLASAASVPGAVPPSPAVTSGPAIRAPAPRPVVVVPSKPVAAPPKVVARAPAEPTPIAAPHAVAVLPPLLHAPAQIELEHITPLLTVKTYDVPGAQSVPMTLPDVERIDHTIASAVGAPLWAKVKAAGAALDDHVDRVSDRLGLAPEGVHPTYADAAKPLLRFVQHPQATKPAEVARADEHLAGLIRRAPPEALPVIDDFLSVSGVDRSLAPKSREALALRLPPLGGGLHDAVGALRSADGAHAADRDADLAAAIKGAPPSQLLSLTRELEDAGFIVRESGFFTWRPTPKGAAAPRALAELAKRNYREETLGAALAHDPRFQELSRENQTLRASAEQHLGEAAGAPFAGQDPKKTIAWGQRLGEKFSDQRLTALASEPPRDLAQRNTTEVFKDHLLRRRENRLDLDLERNYADDVVLTSNHGTFFGHDGIKQSAAVLAKLVPTRDWVMDRLWFEGDVAFETWSAKVDGKLVTGFDAFVIRDGKIAAQTVYYGPGSLR